jgi:hypothetical protein
MSVKMRPTPSTLLRAAFLVAALSMPAQATSLQFAGFSFISDHAEIESRYPNTSALLKEAPRLLDKKLLEQLNEVRRDDLEIVTSKLANLRQGEGLALTLALDDEVVSIEEIGDLHKIVVRLNAQGLVFDFEELSVIASFPIAVEYLDVSTEPPSGEYLRGLVRKLYLGGLEVNLMDEFVASLEAVSIRERFGTRIGVEQVIIGEKATRHLPEYLRESPRAARVMVAQSFSKFLSKNQRVSVLPYTKGHAIGNKMSARFSDGRVFTLEIPEPDYSVALDLRGFKKVEFDKQSSGTSWIYGAYLGIKVYESLTQKVFAELSLKNGVTKLVPASQTSVDDWAAYQESLLSLMQETTQQIDDPKRSWAKSHSADKSAVKHLKNLQPVMEACR